MINIQQRGEETIKGKKKSKSERERERMHFITIDNEFNDHYNLDAVKMMLTSTLLLLVLSAPQQTVDVKKSQNQVNVMNYSVRRSAPHLLSGYCNYCSLMGVAFGRR